MPPNLGGFFMVRSYYPSECHADYFDFERIEALKPAIEACGISTLSQSPMLGFHKQMDNRIKLLEEILSFRMQGVEFLSFISGRLATKSNQIKQLIRNGRSASLQRTFKKSFTSFSHSTRNKTRDGLIRVRNIRALNGRFNTSITHAYSIVIGSKHI